MSGHNHSKGGKQKNNQKITINNSDGETTPLFWEKNKFTVTRSLEIIKRTKNLKVNGMAQMK